MARPDDDALTWDGDDDPTLEVQHPASTDRPEIVEAPGASAPGSPTLPDGWSAVGKGSDVVGVEGAQPAAGPVPSAPGAAPDDADAAPALGNGALIATGVIGGVYLIYAIGWLVGGLRLRGLRTYLVTDVMYTGSLWLATLAPIVWFATVWLLTRNSGTWVRFVWLSAGLLLLIPWPFVLVGAVGQ
jgi:hypothetical protein